MNGTGPELRWHKDLTLGWAVRTMTNNRMRARMS